MEAKEAFDSVCTKIAEKYKDDGWKYSKSNHWMTRKDKNFKYSVDFYTSWNNISEEYVVFYGAFGIESKNTQSGISISTSRCNDLKGRLHWNVAKEEMWDETIEEFTHWLETECFPIMNECMNNLDEYLERVVEQGFYPPHGYKININLILEFGSREMAERAAQHYYDIMSEDEKSDFKANYESLMSCGVAVNSYGENEMRNPSQFRTIIENKLNVVFSEGD